MSRFVAEYQDQRRFSRSTHKGQFRTRKRRLSGHTTNRWGIQGSSSMASQRCPSEIFHCEQWSLLINATFQPQKIKSYHFLGIFAASPKSPTTASSWPSLDFFTSTFCGRKRQSKVSKIKKKGDSLLCWLNHDERRRTRAGISFLWQFLTLTESSCTATDTPPCSVSTAQASHRRCTQSKHEADLPAHRLPWSCKWEQEFFR